MFDALSEGLKPPESYEDYNETNTAERQDAIRNLRVKIASQLAELYNSMSDDEKLAFSVGISVEP